jgi:hypothetical protein
MRGLLLLLGSSEQAFATHTFANRADFWISDEASARTNYGGDIGDSDTVSLAAVESAVSPTKPSWTSSDKSCTAHIQLLCGEVQTMTSGCDSCVNANREVFLSGGCSHDSDLFVSYCTTENPTANPTIVPTVSPTHPCRDGWHRCDELTSTCVECDSGTGFICACLEGFKADSTSSTSCTAADDATNTTTADPTFGGATGGGTGSDTRALHSIDAGNDGALHLIDVGDPSGLQLLELMKLMGYTVQVASTNNELHAVGDNHAITTGWVQVASTNNELHAVGDNNQYWLDHAINTGWTTPLGLTATNHDVLLVDENGGIAAIVVDNGGNYMESKLLMVMSREESERSPNSQQNGKTTFAVAASAGAVAFIAVAIAVGVAKTKRAAATRTTMTPVPVYL